MKGKEYLGEYHPGMILPPIGSEIFNIELSKEDLQNVNRLRSIFGLEGKTNHEVISYVLNAVVEQERRKWDDIDDD
jgi:hypothetical protein